MIIVLIVGLPASGKTHLAEKIAKDRNFGLIDDPVSLDHVLAVLDTNPQGVVIIDPHFCCERTRANVVSFLSQRAPEATLEWIWFANDPESCLANMRRRWEHGDLRKVEDMIKMSSRHYNIPSGVEVLPVWKPG